MSLTCPRPYDIRTRRLIHAAADTVTELFFGGEVVRGWLSVPSQQDIDDAITLHRNPPKETDEQRRERLKREYGRDGKRRAA